VPIENHAPGACDRKAHPWKTIVPSDAAGLRYTTVTISPNGKYWTLATAKLLTDLLWSTDCASRCARTSSTGTDCVGRLTPAEFAPFVPSPNPVLCGHEVRTSDAGRGHGVSSNAGKASADL